MTISIISWLPLVTNERYGTMVSLSRINVDFHFFSSSCMTCLSFKLLSFILPVCNQCSSTLHYSSSFGSSNKPCTCAKMAWRSFMFSAFPRRLPPLLLCRTWPVPTTVTIKLPVVPRSLNGKSSTLPAMLGWDAK
jgi:hypothetical protein